MKIIVVLFLLMSTFEAICQTRYIDRSGKASFFSSALVEDIEANNNQAVSILDVKSGEIVASMLMKSFNFKKALMEEHFNENYIESNKFPKATFKGKITNLDQFHTTKDGKYVLEIDGNITIHGVTRPLKVKGDAVVTNGKIKASAAFPLKVKDFKITIPRLVRNNIAEQVEVSVSFNYLPMNP